MAEALPASKKIIVCTIQTFPFALNAVRDLAVSKGKHFAVIADEAHSSQAGQAAVKLKMTLSASEQQDLQDGREIGEAEVDASAAKKGIMGWVAFTRTTSPPALRSSLSISARMWRVCWMARRRRWWSLPAARRPCAGLWPCRLTSPDRAIILSAQEIAELGLEEAPTEIGPSNEEATVASEKREAGHG